MTDIGTVLGGRYRLVELLGQGGMATIYRARDNKLERDVAVKVLRPEYGADPDFIDRFRHEAQSAASLNHPGIVAAYDYGTDPVGPFIVMELVEGEDLATIIRRTGALPPRAAARLVAQSARALAAAHDRGFVHRDIKPGNILVTREGRVKVTDFGIARALSESALTLPGTTLGSVHYFSPEQARGATTTPASDIYGLGLVLYEALTGSRAFTGDTTDAIALARIGAAPPSPRATRPEVPAELDAVVRRALAPEPDDRYANGNAMAAALESAIQASDDTSPTTIVATPVVSGEPAPGPAHHAERPATARPRAGPSRRATGGRTSRSTPSGVAVALLALMGIVVGAIAVAALPGNAEPLPSDTPSQAVIETPTPTPKPTQAPSPTPKPTAKPTASRTEAPTALPEGQVADLCEVFFDIPCGLGAGRYSPSRFRPEFEIKLGEGWSNATHAEDIVVLTRPEGTLTFAGGLREVYPGGEADEPSSRARDVMEAFIATEGVGATDPADVRIDRRRGFSSDFEPVGTERVPLFSTSSSTFHLEPDRTTRVLVIDLPGDQTVVLAIEPNEGYELRDILETADPAAGTIDWR